MTFLTYLAFDSSGDLVPGLGRNDLEPAIASLVSHTGDSVVASLAALAREMNAASNGAPQGPLMDVVFGPALPEQSASAPVTTDSPAEGAVPRRLITEAERTELGGDDRGLTCDATGIGAAEWDHGPISDGDVRGRGPLDAFRDALTQLSDDARREGAAVLPADGWTELVASESDSYFVLEWGGERKAVISVSGDPALGVWRAGSADLCRSLFLIDGSSTVTVDAYPAGDGIPPVVAPDDPVFVLVVSNQSFDDATVGLAITIDGQPVADDEYEVREQHTTST